ncbi:MAG: hypothetical protein J6C58_07345 [Bacteroidaceae bacterium]|nr:hypothetical protein [Bacteroidaceae bacterium]
MKKLFALLIALMMVFTLAACGDNNTTDPDKDNPGTSQSDNQGGTENQGGEENNGGENNETYDLTTVAGYLASYGYAESDFSSVKNFTRMAGKTGSGGKVTSVDVYISEGLTDDEQTAWRGGVVTLAKGKSDDGKVYVYDIISGMTDREFDPATDFGTFGGTFGYKADGKTIVVNLNITGGVDSSDPDDAMPFANIKFE